MRSANLEAIEPPAEATVYALVDFDNLLPPYEECTPEMLNVTLNELVDRILQTIPKAEQVFIRLYGGWMASGILSRRGSDISAAMSAVGLFPRIGDGSHRVRGSLTLADALVLTPHLRFADTSRRRLTPPRLRLAGNPLPNNCAGTSDSCPARILKKFTSKPSKECPVDGCTVLCTEAFVVQEQKMVDGMLICDLITLSDMRPRVSCVVVSDDTDFVPGLVIAADRSDAVYWALRDTSVAATRGEEIPDSVQLIQLAD